MGISKEEAIKELQNRETVFCLLYTSDAADE